MKIFYDEDAAFPSPRQHPYIAIHEGQSGFVDFKREPGRIPDVLEDFRGHADRPAIQTFYGFLRWINGGNSLLESCDSALKAPEGHSHPHSPRKLCTHGRVMVMYRDLASNCDTEESDWLCDALMRAVDTVDSELSEADAVVSFTLSPALHADLSRGERLPDGHIESSFDDPGRGHHLILTFYAYGDDAEQAFMLLDRVFRNIEAACRAVSKEIGQRLGSSGDRTSYGA